MKMRTGTLGGMALASLVAVIAPACGEGAGGLFATSSGTVGQDATSDPGADRCATPNDGCPCASPGAVVDCGKVFSQSAGYTACAYGKRTCEESGRWGACVGEDLAAQSVAGDRLTLADDRGLTTAGLGAAASCAATNPCDPACTNFVDTSVGLDGGPDARFVVTDGAITAVNDPTAAPCPPGGALFCNIARCAGTAKTTFRGRVFDPRGQNPIFNATVFVPANFDPLPPIPDGPAADACGGVPAVPALASAVTDANGVFELQNVPSGVNIPLVIQVGKWRRQFTVAPLVSCVTNDLTSLTDNVPILGSLVNTVVRPRFRLPSTKAEGNIPKMAMSLGSADALGCFFTKLGLDPAEHTAPSGTGRLNFFAGNGYGTVNGAAAPAANANLWNSMTNLRKYDIILNACEGAENNGSKTAADILRMRQYVNTGGRFFATHFHYVWFSNDTAATDATNGPAMRPSATWTPGGFQYDATDNYPVNTTFARGVSFRDWLRNVGALNTTPADSLSVFPGRLDMGAAPASSQVWITTPTAATCVRNGQNKCVLDPDQNLGRLGRPAYMSFNAPIGAALANQYGKGVMSDVHVGTAPADTNVPTSCLGASCLADATCGAGGTCERGRCIPKMTPQEKALEFLYFDLASCVSNANDPRPKTYFPNDAVFSRDFVATCPAQQRPRWTFLDVQGEFPGPGPAGVDDPSATRVEFRFVTGDSVAALDAQTKPAAAAEFVRGNKSYTAWYRKPVDTGALLGKPSGTYLRVWFDLKASADRTLAPSLTAWRQSYTCVDAE